MSSRVAEATDPIDRAFGLPLSRPMRYCGVSSGQVAARQTHRCKQGRRKMVHGNPRYRGDPAIFLSTLTSAFRRTVKLAWPPRELTRTVSPIQFGTADHRQAQARQGGGCLPGAFGSARPSSGTQQQTMRQAWSGRIGRLRNGVWEVVANREWRRADEGQDGYLGKGTRSPAGDN